MELTKEYFDEQLNILATKDDLKPLATKEDVRTEIKKGVGELAAIIAKTIAVPMQQHFDQLHDELTVRARVTQLESDLQKIKLALHIS